MQVPLKSMETASSRERSVLSYLEEEVPASLQCLQRKLAWLIQSKHITLSMLKLGTGNPNQLLSKEPSFVKRTDLDSCTTSSFCSCFFVVVVIMVVHTTKLGKNFSTSNQKVFLVFFNGYGND